MLELMPVQKQPPQERLSEIREDMEDSMAADTAELQEICMDPSKQYQSVIDINCDGLQVTIINDIGKIFTPVLDFNLEEFQFIIYNNNVSSKIYTTLTFSSKYFNSRISDWEPVVEQVRFHIDIINTVGNVRSLICLKIGANLRLGN